jgi:hypothetical protein
MSTSSYLLAASINQKYSQPQRSNAPSHSPDLWSTRQSFGSNSQRKREDVLRGLESRAWPAQDVAAERMTIMVA